MDEMSQGRKLAKFDYILWKTG